MQLHFDPSETPRSGAPWRDEIAELQRFDIAFALADEITVLLPEDLGTKEKDKAITNLVRIARDRGCAITLDHIGFFPTRVRATLRRKA